MIIDPMIRMVPWLLAYIILLSDILIILYGLMFAGILGVTLNT